MIISASIRATAVTLFDRNQEWLIIFFDGGIYTARIAKNFFYCKMLNVASTYECKYRLQLDTVRSGTRQAMRFAIDSMNYRAHFCVRLPCLFPASGEFIYVQR